MSQAASVLVLFGVLLHHVFSGGPFEPPFGCQGLKLSEQNRTETLNLINRMRSKVALGQFRAQNILSSASNMDKMAWNCELEKLAEEVVAKCRKNLPPIGRKYGRNYLLFGPSSTVYQRQFPLQSAMKQWSAISNLAWPASNIFNGNLALRPFANIIRAKTVSVGCSADKCRGRSAVACVFSSPNVRRRSKVYISGTPCQDDHQCNRFSPAFCENGLCVNSVRLTTTALPTTTSTTASTTTTTTSATTSTTASTSTTTASTTTPTTTKDNDYKKTEH
ncbi:hypothetical protein KIN20_023885 [Parelaphostrongylus tenuis]|uniref:SCP domain-containing protein n=1 Tax=Parelaphostrongylus tenuis TaxID=148309 RepID=A0AAD5N700_PARTN|nr:hypothetical protein KIN20_023885 [Parelaphostrongylus tenuis]